MSQLYFGQRALSGIRGWFAANSIPLKLFFVSRFGLFLLVYLSLILIPVNNSPGLWRPHPENLLIDGWSRFDSGWYDTIVDNGYTDQEVTGEQNTAFFPMYPLLMRLSNIIIRDPQLSGIVVSNVSFLAALIVLFKLLSNKYGSEIAERTLILISFCAFSFFFSAVYTESVFLLAVAFAFYFAERKKYFWAAIWGAVAGATRTVGVLIIVPLFFQYLENIGYDWRRIRLNILALSLCLLGTIGYMIFLSINNGNAFQFLESQAQWGQISPLQTITTSINYIYLSYESILNGSYPAMNLIHLLIFIASIILAVFYSKKIGLPYTLFTIIGIATSLSRAHGIGRYLVVLFPLFVAAAFFLKNRDFYHLFLYINILLLALFSIMFSHWYWVA